MLILLKTRTTASSLSRDADLQIFDLLQLSKMERECREIFIALKDQLRETADNEKKYTSINETILRRRAENAAVYYRFVRRERIRLFRNYIERLPTHNSVAA